MPQKLNGSVDRGGLRDDEWGGDGGRGTDGGVGADAPMVADGALPGVPSLVAGGTAADKDTGATRGEWSWRRESEEPIKHCRKILEEHFHRSGRCVFWCRGLDSKLCTREEVGDVHRP